MDGVVRMQAARASRARFQTNLNQQNRPKWIAKVRCFPVHSFAALLALIAAACVLLLLLLPNLMAVLRRFLFPFFFVFLIFLNSCPILFCSRRMLFSSFLFMVFFPFPLNLFVLIFFRTGLEGERKLLHTRMKRSLLFLFFFFSSPEENSGNQIGLLRPWCLVHSIDHRSRRHRSRGRNRKIWENARPSPDRTINSRPPLPKICQSQNSNNRSRRS
ncbi:hypothetical protein BO94DRAFT_74573 [Aspergillus sclerotioniger CBS 115572]|uniref:Transmembrane protein n=1 Tax=Aspergillus sclerotioniger CBS 115572 TaxID=1450535 RepID=A0A317WQA7_9EURO|nr:hypothetical protein BO94DRAFT_74573 [Aspergillus sclerotioniger CBS 115572]PWY87307.1 hypothetical protein BO94DRAFT_74573 [Aspergillus sclerotioniger CBS 115572]